MIRHQNHSPGEIRYFIRNGKIAFAGNIPARIYGTLGCFSGKRMKKENRVFFETEAEAISSNFRPCGHCLRAKYIAVEKEPIIKYPVLAIPNMESKVERAAILIGRWLETIGNG